MGATSALAHQHFGATTTPVDCNVISSHLVFVCPALVSVMIVVTRSPLSMFMAKVAKSGRR